VGNDQETEDGRNEPTVILVLSIIAGMFLIGAGLVVEGMIRQRGKAYQQEVVFGVFGATCLILAFVALNWLVALAFWWLWILAAAVLVIVVAANSMEALKRWGKKNRSSREVGQHNAPRKAVAAPPGS
jgi:fatty acid desaturase